MRLRWFPSSAQALLGLKNRFDDWANLSGMKQIDTSLMTPREVAEEIMRWHSTL